MSKAVRLSAENVALSLRSAAGLVPILQNVSLSVKPGERVGITGASGSGKTSLLMVLAGIERPQSGRILFYDTAGASLALHDLDETALARWRRTQLGIVFQSFHLIPTMTAEENVALPLQFARARNAMQQARAILEQLGLSHRLTHYPVQLSGGEQQRVALARALGARPALIFADEPTGNLDYATGQDIIALLLSVPERYGASLVLVTHDLDLAARCERQLHMQDGQLSNGSAQG